MKNIDNAHLPAMPNHYAEITNRMGGTDELYAEHQGMTKIEIIAMHAMQGELAGSASHSRPEPEDVANYAVMCADALLAALEKRKKLDFSSKS